ncbi:hypothetical protein Acr_21g0002350 [Actinidia rufa]|uniref:Uncharacterized protein n=1 Tax=Actinidia rufa TaxID=165716 RepID=A0A7J0GFQ4_9ERIC|nr:hypothetical protein Acr_21g0002350 [Actinidia rufa]
MLDIDTHWTYPDIYWASGHRKQKRFSFLMKAKGSFEQYRFCYKAIVDELEGLISEFNNQMGS